MQVDRVISEPASNTADGNPHLKLTDAEYNRIISLRFETTSNSASLLHDRFRARVDELELELKEKQEQLKAAINEKFNAENEKETLVSRLHVEAQERAKVISRIQQIDKYCEIVKSSYSSTIRKHSALEAEISDVNSDFENTFSAIKAAHVQFKSLLTEAAQQKDELKRENSSLTAQISVLREQEIQSEYKLQQGDCLLSAERKKATDLSAKIHTLEKKIEQGIAEAGRLLSVKERTENLFNQQAAKLVECQNEAHALRTLNQQLLCDLNVSSQQREKHERDMSVLLERCDSFTKQIEQLQGENKKLNHELLAEAEASALSKRALMNTTEQKNLEIEALNEQLGMMKCDAKKVTDERDKLSAIVIDTQARLTDLERDRDAGKTLLAESNIRETQLQAENAAFCERLKVLEQEVGSRMAQLNEQKTTFDGLIEKHLAENRERCTSIENELQQSNSRIESLSSTLSLSNEKVTRLEKENADLHESLTTLQSKLACSVPVEEYNKKVREVDECRRELADVKRSSTVDKQICSLNFSSPITRPVADVNATKNSTTTLVSSQPTNTKPTPAASNSQDIPPTAAEMATHAGTSSQFNVPFSLARRAVSSPVCIQSDHQEAESFILHGDLERRALTLNDTESFGTFGDQLNHSVRASTPISLARSKAIQSKATLKKSVGRRALLPNNHHELFFFANQEDSNNDFLFNSPGPEKSARSSVQTKRPSVIKRAKNF